MTEAIAFEQLPLSTVGRRCSQETANFRSRAPFDPRYCLELFRRAVLHRDQQAWELIYAQYRAQVMSWIRRHPLIGMLDEEAPYYANRAFERLWSVMTPEKWQSFSDLKGILRYLQLCVHSVIVDAARSKEQARIAETLEVEEELEPADDRPPVEEQVLSRARRQELWQWLCDQLRDEREYRLVYAKFVLGLKPPELVAQYPEAFSDVREVYRLTESVMNRLRNSPELAGFLNDL